MGDVVGVYALTSVLALASAWCVRSMCVAKEDEPAICALLGAIFFGFLAFWMVIGCWSVTVHEACRGEEKCSVSIMED